MAVLLVDTLLNRNLNRNLNRIPNRNPNPLTAGRRSHIRPVPHGYDQRTCCGSSPPASRQYVPASLSPAPHGQASFWPQAHPDTPRIPMPSRGLCQRTGIDPGLCILSSRHNMIPFLNLLDKRFQSREVFQRPSQNRTCGFPTYGSSVTFTNRHLSP